MALALLDYQNTEDRRSLTALINRLREQTTGGGEAAQRAAAIVEDVRREGDEALVRYMRKWTDPAFSREMIRVSPGEIAAAEHALSADLRGAIERSIDHVRAYQQHVMPADPPPIEIDGAKLGLRFTPIPRVGLHVPGGRAAYPSSLIMLAVPAQTAGVERISVVTPPPTRAGETETKGHAPGVSPLVLGVCGMLGIDRVYRLGGAQAIAALALGSESVEPVDFIAGPGNAYTQQAKRQVFGRVGIDGLFGPSEIVVLADETAEPRWIAADLLAQAEHDPGCCFLLSRSRDVIEKTTEAIREQLPSRRRRGAIERALREWSAAVLLPDQAAAADLIDELAAEHVTLAVADAEAALANFHHAGAWFLGDATPVASGDYYAGPSHCLPTGTTARYSSGLSAYTFLKRSSVERYHPRPGDRALDDIARLAEAEGLEAHAASARIRKRR